MKIIASDVLVAVLILFVPPNLQPLQHEIPEFI